MHAKVVLLRGCITTVRIHSNYYQLFRFVSSDTKSANLASEPFKGIQGISFLLRRKVAPEAFNVCLACVKWMFAVVEGSCTNKLIRCLTKHWRRTPSNSRFSTAAENQLFTWYHGVYNQNHAQNVTRQEPEQCFTDDSFFMILSGYAPWIQISLHHVVRRRSCASTNA